MTKKQAKKSKSAPAQKMSNAFTFDPQEEGTVLIWQSYAKVRGDGANGSIIGTIEGKEVSWRCEKVPPAIKRYAAAICAA